MKILVVSNQENVDGAGTVVLTKVLFNSPDDQVDYALFNCKNVHSKMRDLIRNHELDGYDLVLLTAIFIGRDVLDEIDSSPLRDKTYMIDHNKWSLKYNDYDWTFIERYWDEERASATNLLLEWFKFHFEDLKPTDGVREFVELTRRLENNILVPGDQKAKNLQRLFDEVGPDDYIESMSAKLNAFFNLYFDRFDMEAIEANIDKEKNN